MSQQYASTAEKEKTNQLGSSSENASFAGQSLAPPAFQLKASAPGGGVVQRAGKPPTPMWSKLGDLDYYTARHNDFLKRNPGKTPPEYYMGYGNKYIHRFTKETKTQKIPGLEFSAPLPCRKSSWGNHSDSFA